MGNVENVEIIMLVMARYVKRHHVILTKRRIVNGQKVINWSVQQNFWILKANVSSTTQLSSKDTLTKSLILMTSNLNSMN
jgi:hypothetical protein